MIRFRHLCATAALAVMLFFGCASPHGQLKKGSETVAPNEVLEFGTLYAENCAGCHGVEGRGSIAIALSDPAYLAVADDTVMRKVISNGVRGTAMPAFAESAGGMLTDKQIDALVSGIRSWANSGLLHGAAPPPYAAKTSGDLQRGADVYQTFCSSCHGPDGTGGKKASSIVDGSYLALVSDQHLRTTVIAGRPELGAPDWREDVPGRPMSDQEVTDVVAWLSSRRAHNPDQPYPNSKNVQH